MNTRQFLSSCLDLICLFSGPPLSLLILMAGPDTGHESTLDDSMGEVRSWPVLKDRLDERLNWETLGRPALILSHFW